MWVVMTDDVLCALIVGSSDRDLNPLHIVVGQHGVNISH